MWQFFDFSNASFTRDQTLLARGPAQIRALRASSTATSEDYHLIKVVMKPDACNAPAM